MQRAPTYTSSIAFLNHYCSNKFSGANIASGTRIQLSSISEISGNLGALTSFHLLIHSIRVQDIIHSHPYHCHSLHWSHVRRSNYPIWDKSPSLFEARRRRFLSRSIHSHPSDKKNNTQCIGDSQSRDTLFEGREFSNQSVGDGHNYFFKMPLGTVGPVICVYLTPLAHPLPDFW